MKIKSIILCLLLILAIGTVPFFSLVNVSAADLPYYGLTRTFTIYGSTAANYTGPAAVKSVLHYLSGDNYLQSELASSLKTDAEGTFLKNMVSLINQSQKNSKLAVYNDKDFETVIWSLYDTVVRRNTPAIIGIAPDGISSWPDGHTNRHFVVIYQIRSDLSYFKVADPMVLYDPSKGGKSFYTVSAEALFEAYKAANTGLTYGVEVYPMIPEPSLSTSTIELTLSSSRWSANETFTYTISNRSEQRISFGQEYAIDKWSDAKERWEEIALPSGFAWPALQYELSAGKKMDFQMQAFLTLLNPAAGSYRIRKFVNLNGETKMITSTSFSIN